MRGDAQKLFGRAMRPGAGHKRFHNLAFRTSNFSLLQKCVSQLIAPKAMS